MSTKLFTSPAIEHQEKIADLPFEENRAVGETAQTLRDEMLYHRATQTYLWALPLINTLGMQRGSEKAFGGGYDVLPVWRKRLDAQTLVTTPNSDVIYAMSYVDLGKDGPLVFEAPPMLQGILLDFWQRPIPVDGGKFAGDVGFFGPDQGKGGKFLLLPPGYKGEVPEGYFVYRSGTNNVFVFLRAFYADASDLKPPVDLIEKAKIYPLGGGARPMKFPDASGVPADMLPPSDVTAFELLKKLVDAEGPHLADPDWMGMLAGLGIVKGEPFDPDERTRGILDRAAKSAYKMSRVNAFDEVVSGRSFRMYPDRRWLNPMADATAENPSGKLDLQRAAQAYLDFMPAMSMQALLDMHPRDYGVSETGGMIVYTEPGEGRSKDLGLTYNTESMYASASVDLRQTGPAVIEVPPNVLGVINDGFFLYLADLGNAGPDRGQGGKYLLLPPGYEGDVPEGYFVFRSSTWRNWVMARGFEQDTGRGEAALAYYKAHFKVYPLGEDVHQPSVVSASFKPSDSTFARDIRFFERRLPGRRTELSPAAADRNSGEELLVGDRLRHRDALAAAERPAQAEHQQRLRPNRGESGRLGRHLLRPESARGQGEELDPDGARTRATLSGSACTVRWSPSSSRPGDPTTSSW